MGRGGHIREPDDIVSFSEPPLIVFTISLGGSWGANDRINRVKVKV